MINNKVVLKELPITLHEKWELFKQRYESTWDGDEEYVLNSVYKEFCRENHLNYENRKR